MSKKTLFTLLACTTLLQGCIAAAVVGVVGGASMASDNRTLGNQIDDQKIELDAHSLLAKQEALSKHANLQVVSINGNVLVIGQTPNTYLQDLAIKTLNQVKGINQLHNQIRVSNTTSVTTKSNDIWLTSKVKTALFGSDHLDATNIKVITENGEVFLMGVVSKQEANAAVEIARNVGGVNRVLKIFEYIP